MDLKVGRQRLTASGLISHKPGYLVGIILTPDGVNNSYCDIYDGENTTGELIVRLRVQSTRSFYADLKKNLYLRTGLYIDFGANLEAVTVFFEGA